MAETVSWVDSAYPNSRAERINFVMAFVVDLFIKTLRSKPKLRAGETVPFHPRSTVEMQRPKVASDPAAGH